MHTRTGGGDILRRLLLYLHIFTYILFTFYFFGWWWGVPAYYYHHYSSSSGPTIENNIGSDEWPWPLGARAVTIVLFIRVRSSFFFFFFRTPSDRFNWIKMRNAPLRRIIAGVSGSKPQCGQGTWRTYYVYVWVCVCIPRYKIRVFHLFFFVFCFFLCSVTCFFTFSPKSA